MNRFTAAAGPLAGLPCSDVWSSRLHRDGHQTYACRVEGGPEVILTREEYAVVHREATAAWHALDRADAIRIASEENNRASGIRAAIVAHDERGRGRARKRVARTINGPLSQRHIPHDDYR